MAQGTLVANKKHDGWALINHLTRDGVLITVAFWAKATERSSWNLYVATPAVYEARRGDAFIKAVTALGKIANCKVTPLDLNVIGDQDPRAQDAAEEREHRAIRDPEPLFEVRFGDLEAAEAWIYPKRFPREVREREGRWEVQISDVDDEWITCDSEEDARSIAIAQVLQEEALARVKSGPQFAAELEKTAEIMEKYRMGFGSRFLRQCAQKALQS